METKKEMEFRMKVYEFLNSIRASGVTNMFGVAPYVQEEFELSKSEASNYVVDWMARF